MLIREGGGFLFGMIFGFRGVV
ncbi:hypothetical protein LINPERHAP1_LOCUS7193 [Linum perenne]